MGAEKLSEQLEQIVLKRIAEDSLVLPTLPAVVTKALEVLKDPEVSFKQVGTIIERDPVLAARLLRAATSAAFAGGTKKVTLPEALARLGGKSVRTLLVEATAQRVFVSRDPKIADSMKRVWQHSVAVATLSRDVLALSGNADSEAAYLAGLLHDVGKPVVASILLEFERQVTEVYNRPFIDSAEWVSVIGRTHRPVGVALAEKWQMPEQVTRCIRDCAEYDNADRASLVNIVCFSNSLAKKTGIYAGPIDGDEVDALVMIGRSIIGANDDIIKTLTRGLKERVAGLYD
ncbi:MAG TPA: HDOD domain-containing protein [Anaeromyxobacteraceae bacterium]|nr:HDOD domain-containing protein [Anaeromyxobacteraceae bacterium]